MRLNQVTLPASDIEKSSHFYRELGFTQIVDSPHYARFQCPEGDASFSIHLTDPPIVTSGVVVYFESDNLEQICDSLAAKGIEFNSPPKEQRWLWTEARLFDPAGNEICLYHAGDNRLNPPWRVNRTNQDEDH